MPSTTTITRQASGLTFARQFAASQALVFRTLSEAEHLKNWWGPPSCPVDECAIDFRPGGVWRYSLRLPNGSRAWTYSVYREIVPPQRITYLERSSDASGNVTDERPAAICLITLQPTESGTSLTVVVQYETTLDRDKAIRNGVERGFPSALDQLDQLIDRSSRLQR